MLQKSPNSRRKWQRTRRRTEPIPKAGSLRPRVLSLESCVLSLASSLESRISSLGPNSCYSRSKRAFVNLSKWFLHTVNKPRHCDNGRLLRWSDRRTDERTDGLTDSWNGDNIQYWRWPCTIAIQKLGLLRLPGAGMCVCVWAKDSQPGAQVVCDDGPGK